MNSVRARSPKAHFTRWTVDVDMEFPERRTTSVLLTIFVFAVVCALAYTARHVLLLFVLSVFFAYLMNPAVRFLQHHSPFFKNLRGAAVIGILVLIAVAAPSFAPAVIRNTMRAVDAVPAVVDGLSTGEIAAEIGSKYGWSGEQTERVKTVLLRHKQNFEGLQEWIDGSLSQAAQIVGWLALVPIVAIFLLREGGRIVEAGLQTFCPQKHGHRARMIAFEIHCMLTSYIRAQVLLCLFSLAFYMVVLFLFRFPHPIALSVLGGVLEFIPVFGWMSTAAVIVGVGMANDLHWLWMAGLLLLWRVTQDYFNVPRVLGHGLEVHPLTIIFAVLIGAEVGGIVGIFLAVPVTASLFLIWRLHTRAADVAVLNGAGAELPPSFVEVTHD